MASKNKTPNLQLNQWAADDPVLREDFNADNAKLDAALSATTYCKLKEVVTSQSAIKVELDLSDIDPDAYSMLYIHMELRTSANNPRNPGDTVDTRVYMYLNQPTSGRNFGNNITSEYHETFYQQLAVGTLPEQLEHAPAIWNVQLYIGPKGSDGNRVFSGQSTSASRYGNSSSSLASTLLTYAFAAYWSKLENLVLEKTNSAVNHIGAGTKFYVYGVKR